MALLQKLVKLAGSPAGRKLIDEAQRRAKDPATRAQVEQLARKVKGRRSGGAPGTYER